MEPKIRLKGFSGEWKTAKIGTVAPITGGYAFQSNCFVNNGVPIVRISNILDSGVVGGDFAFYDSFPGDEQFKLHKDDIVIAMSGATTGKVAIIKDDKTYYQNQRVGKFSKTGKVDYSYLSTIVGSDKFLRELYRLLTASAQPNASSKDIDSISIPVPQYKNEQEAIALYFSNLDSLIQSTTKKIESLKQVKAASLQSMFPQSGEAAPRVRFKEYANKWKTCKLNSILTERHEASTITQELPQLSFTIADGVIRPEDRKSNQRDFLIKDKVNKRYLITRIGDIIYNPANVVYGAIHRNSLTDGVVSPIYRIFSTEEDSRFIECVVRRPSFISQLAMRTEGTVTKLKTLKPEAFLDMEVCIPTDIEEQKAIGEYFRNLDQQIILQAKRLDKLKQIKSACLDNMFV